mgnify:CR=1 FL=1
MNLNGQQLLTNLQSQFLKPNLPTIKIGDNIKIGVKIIEGNRSCMFDQEQMEKDVERKAKKYERDNPNTNDTQSTLARVSGLDVDINAKV